MPLRGIGTLEGLMSPYPPSALTDFNMVGNTALAADTYYRNLTINNSLVLNLSGYCLFVRDTLTLGDDVEINVIDKTSLNGGTTSGATGGAAGTTAPTGTIGGAMTSAGAGGSGGVGANAITLPSVGIHLGGGGGGGAGGSLGAGGNGGMQGTSGGGGGSSPSGNGNPGALIAFTNQAGLRYESPTSTIRFGNILGIQALLTGHLAVLGTNYPIYGGGGGGGGGADNTGGSRGGGGGGAGGGVARIIAGRIVRSGGGTAPRISAVGGNGGTGDGGGVSNPGPGGAGGGGVILLGAGQLDRTVQLLVTAGTAGQPANYAGTGKFGGAAADGRVFFWQL